MPTLSISGQVIVPVGGAAEGDYTQWPNTFLTDKSVSGLLDWPLAVIPYYVSIDNNGNVLMVEETVSSYVLVNNAGTIIARGHSNGVSSAPYRRFAQTTLSGKYQVLWNAAGGLGGTIEIYSEGALLFSLDLAGTLMDDTLGTGGVYGLAISPSGQWIVLVNTDQAAGAPIITILKGS